MGTWSIDPSGTLASIDSTGKLTYQEHTEDKTYKITYQDDTCGPITKDITIKKCVKEGIKIKIVDNKFGATTASTVAISTDYEGVGTGILIYDIEVNGPAKNCDVDPKFINTNITQAVVYCDNGTYLATYAPSKIENGQTYTLTLDKKVRYVGKSLYFNVSTVSGGTPGQQYVFNALRVTVSMVKAGQTFFEHVKEFSCPCPGSACTEGYELTSSVNFGFGEYIDADLDPEGAIIYVNIDNAVVRDKDDYEGKRCNYIFQDTYCPVPGWSGSKQSWSAIYSSSLNDGSFSLMFK